MKNLKLFYFFAAVFLMSCSSVQVVDSYVTPDFKNSKSQDFLVITRVNDNNVRNAFEQSMVKELGAEGIQSSASAIVFPNLDMSQKYNQSQINSFISTIQSKGFDGVVLNVLKNVQNETSTYPVGGGDFYNYYPSYYYGFGGYYMNPMAYSTYMGPTEYQTDTYQVYTLETTVYDLNLPSNKQLIGIVTNQITDPANIIYDSDEYAEKVVKELMKKSK